MKLSVMWTELAVLNSHQTVLALSNQGVAAATSGQHGLLSSATRAGATNRGVSPPSRIVFAPPRRACHLRPTSHLCLSLLRILMTVCTSCSF